MLVEGAHPYYSNNSAPLLVYKKRAGKALPEESAPRFFFFFCFLMKPLRAAFHRDRLSWSEPPCPTIVASHRSVHLQQRGVGAQGMSLAESVGVLVMPRLGPGWHAPLQGKGSNCAPSACEKGEGQPTGPLSRDSEKLRSS